jgi:hypothetical protein
LERQVANAKAGRWPQHKPLFALQSVKKSFAKWYKWVWCQDVNLLSLFRSLKIPVESKHISNNLCQIYQANNTPEKTIIHWKHNALCGGQTQSTSLGNPTLHENKRPDIKQMAAGRSATHCYIATFTFQPQHTNIRAGKKMNTNEMMVHCTRCKTKNTNGPTRAQQTNKQTNERTNEQTNKQTQNPN